MASNLAVRHYLQFTDFSADEYAYLLERSAFLKAKFKRYETWHPLHDRTLAMIFEKTPRAPDYLLKQVSISWVAMLCF